MGVFLFNSCSNNNCNNVDCGEFGNCVELEESTLCSCNAGYEKDDEELCNIKSALKFLGTWSATETRFNNNTFTEETLEYTITIEQRDTIANRIFLSNLGDLDNATCTFSGAIAPLATVSVSSLSFVKATYCPSADFSGYLIENLTGSDTISTDRQGLGFNYHMVFTRDQEVFDVDCTVVLEKQ
ncbi:MAG: hypothetical protein AAFY71_27515 [Bacteroidota bacterium]